MNEQWLTADVAQGRRGPWWAWALVVAVSLAFFVLFLYLALIDATDGLTNS